MARTFAIAGIARAGITRSHDVGSFLGLTVDGVDRTSSFDRNTWRISERPNGQANTMRVEVFGFTPAAGEEVVFGHGTILNQLFKGKIAAVSKVHNRLNEGRVVWACDCVDWGYELAGVLVTRKFTSTSATAIAQTLVALASGFTSTHVQSGLATVDEIQFTMVSLPSALQQLADRIGAYWYVDFDKGVHFFTSEQAGPQELDATNLHARRVGYKTDIDGLRNRILVEGQGASVEAAVPAGTTAIPVGDLTAFATSGTNYAKLEAQVISYTGATGGGAATDSSSALIAAPPNTMVGVPNTTVPSGAMTPNATYGYAITWVTAAGESTPTATVFVTMDSGGRGADLSSMPTTTDPAITGRWIYRTEPNGTLLYRLANSLGPIDTTTTTRWDGLANDQISLSHPAPTTNTAGNSGIPTPAGSTSLPVVDTSVFSASGGWAIAPGDQLFSYTGRSTSSGAGSLTGIPASGVGSLTAAVTIGEPVAVTPHLTGVPADGEYSIRNALTAGEGINVLVISEDLTSQGTYGVRSYFIQDRRLSRAGCAERGAAYLAIAKDARITGSVVSTDPALRAGKALTIDVTEWGITATVTVQSVEITPSAWPHPIRAAVFASRSVEDLYVQLREIKEQINR